MSATLLEHFRSTFFEQTGLPVAILDTAGRILDWNPAAERLLDYGRDEVEGRSALLVRRPEDARKLELLLKRTARERRVADFQTWVSRRDGSEIPVAMNVCPLADPGGKVAAVGVVLRDQRRQKALERRLAEHRKMVAVGRLAGGLSHHVNNILAAVSARVELALATPDPGAVRQALRLTAESVDRLANITRNLLLFSGAERRPPSVCRPDAVARQVADHMRDEIAEAGLALVDRIEKVSAVPLDAADLRQVLENLILNAREALTAPGTIAVTVSQAAGEVVLAVEDTGCGIDPEDLSQVFEPFWTTRGSLAGGAGEALGLGLTVARSLVASAGGVVDITSGPAGTTLTVRLPTVAAGGKPLLAKGSSEESPPP